MAPKWGEPGRGPAGFHLAAACSVNSLLAFFLFRFCFVLRKTHIILKIDTLAFDGQQIAAWYGGVWVGC